MNFKSITIMICPATAEELMPLYEEDKALRKALGLFEETFEKWFADTLELGCLHTIKRNAEIINAGHRKMLEEK